jgi:fermentation-respiration switch protein FrsA (DUF1100 family)
MRSLRHAPATLAASALVVSLTLITLPPVARAAPVAEPRALRGGCVQASKPYGVGTVTLELGDAQGAGMTTTVNYPTPAGSSGSGATAACGKFPLVVAGHGAQGNGASAAALHTFLTNRGYVVAAPSFPSGFDFDRFAADVSRVITGVLAESQDGGSPLHGIVKRSRVGYIGTSMGGMIGLGLYRSCCLDERIDAVISKIGMAPGGSDYRWASGPPLLMINGDADTVIPYDAAVQAYEAAHRPKGLITLAGVGHDLNVGSDPILRDAPLGFFGAFLKGLNRGLARVEAAAASSSVATLRSSW